MSGFIGLLHTDHTPIDFSQLTRLTAAMAFRGTEKQQAWADGEIGLGHTLFQPDSEARAESQPLTLDGSAWIVASARIDGRGELVHRLRAAGRHVTLDQPDAELILHAYLALGDACLDHLIGDFAFVIWDTRRRRLLAARDQVGIAQLFYAQTSSQVIVGNTLQAILLHPDISSTLDDQFLADFSVFGVLLDDAATGYKAIRRVPPGHKLTWDSSGGHVARYWELNKSGQPIRHRRPNDYVNDFRELFDQAVADRLRTSRVATQLSGGMDSTSIAVSAHRSLKAKGQPFDLRGYSVEFGVTIADQEGQLASQVGGYAGFPVEVISGESLLHVGPPEVPAWLPPEPGVVHDPMMREICSRSASSAAVLLTGYGGDPLLRTAPLSWRRGAQALGRGNWRWPLRHMRDNAYQLRRQQRPGPPPAWVASSGLHRFDLDGRARELTRLSRSGQVGMLTAPTWRSLFAWSDPSYSGLGLSIRFPFFDLRLIDYVLSIPPVPWLEHKSLLRAAMRDRLPDAILDRPKTPMAGNVWLEARKQTGIPRWEVDLLTRPEMEQFVSQDWMRTVQNQTAADQAQTWATARPPVQLAYWLRHRSKIPTNCSRGPESKNVVKRVTYVDADVHSDR